MVYTGFYSCEHTVINSAEEKCDPSAFIDTSRIYFYYVEGERQFLTLIPDLLAVQFDSTASDDQIDSLFTQYGLMPLSILDAGRRRRFLVKVPPGKRAEEFFTFYGIETDCGFGNQDPVVYATPTFAAESPKGSKLLLTNEFIVNLDTTIISLRQFDDINNRHHVEIVELLFSSVYLLKVTRKSYFNALDMANLYYNFDFIIFSEPNFLTLIPRH